MTRYAAAYLRRSVASESNPGDASEAAQTQAVQQMCGPNVTLYKDWGISGLKGNRPDYLRLKADIAAGLVESVCAYSLSRLGRSARELLDFVALCREHNVTIRTKVDGMDSSTASGRAALGVFAVFAELEAELARERSIAGTEALKAEGHDLRRAGVGYKAETDAKGLRVIVPDGSADAVLNAYREAKTIEGAAKLLTERKVPTFSEAEKARRAAERGETYTPEAKVWGTSVVARTIRNHAPELLPPKQPGKKATYHGKGLYGQLFRCPECDGILTPNLPREQLYCNRARRLPHSKATIALSKVRPFMEKESAKYQPEGIILRSGGNDAERQRLTKRKSLLGQALADETISPEAYAQQRDDVNAQLAALDSTDQALTAIIPSPVGVDWTQSDEAIGDQLRLIWSYVSLDPTDWTPKRAVWRVPKYLFSEAARTKYIAEQDAAVEDAQKAGA